MKGREAATPSSAVSGRQWWRWIDAQERATRLTNQTTPHSAMSPFAAH